MYSGCTRAALGMYPGCTRDVLGMYSGRTRDVLGMYSGWTRGGPGMYSELTLHFPPFKLFKNYTNLESCVARRLGRSRSPEQLPIGERVAGG